jgi:hypothetical protein
MRSSERESSVVFDNFWNGDGDRMTRRKAGSNNVVRKAFHRMRHYRVPKTGSVRKVVVDHGATHTHFFCHEPTVKVFKAFAFCDPKGNVKYFAFFIHAMAITPP